jgi:hypothetical protein
LPDLSFRPCEPNAARVPNGTLLLAIPFRRLLSSRAVRPFKDDQDDEARDSEPRFALGLACVASLVGKPNDAVHPLGSLRVSVH